MPWVERRPGRTGSSHYIAVNRDLAGRKRSAGTFSSRRAEYRFHFSPTRSSRSWTAVPSSPDRPHWRWCTALTVTIAGFPALSSIRERHDGWLAAHRDKGRGCREQWQVQSALDRYDAYWVARGLLDQRHRPRAVFTHTDEQAVGVLYAAASLGLHVPTDLALASFDDNTEARIVQPSLTTARQPIPQAVKLAVDVLVGDADGAPVAPPSQPLPTQLVLRDSCGC